MNMGSPNLASHSPLNISDQGTFQACEAGAAVPSPTQVLSLQKISG